jgi:hypothetical protein
MSSPKIGMEIYIAAYAANGIIITAPSTSPCRATSASSSKNTGTIARNVPNTAHTCHCLNNKEVKPGVLSPQIHLPCYRKKRYQTGAANHRKHPLLCSSRGPHRSHGPQCNRQQTIKRYAAHHDENKTTHGLLGDTSRRNGKIPRI